jgi:endoglycosylceramidase
MSKKVSLSLLVIVALWLAVATKVKVDPKLKTLVDEAGNIRIFHGLNVAYKLPPYLPPITDRFDFKNSFSVEDAIRLKSWGMNVVRLTIYWEAVEPYRGKYNDQYLSKVEEIVKICAKYDIQVIIDAHQDIANKKFCGEGMPDWAIKPNTNPLTRFPAPLFNIKMEYDSEGYPTKESCLKNAFPTYYATYEVEDAFDNLFANWNGIGDAFANMWGYVARRFKAYPNLLGYEIINEPWVGNIYKKPYILVKQQNMMKFYNKVHTAIRAVDDQSIIFYEHPLSDAILTSVHGTPGGAAYSDRQMLSYHVYPSAVGDPKRTIVDNTVSKVIFNHFFGIMDSENVAGILTEFGAISGLTKPGNDNMRYILDQADTRLHSWAYWQYKYYEDYTTAARPSECEGFFDGSGNVIHDKVKVLARPYVVSSSLKIL